jgi:hypothetical protein
MTTPSPQIGTLNEKPLHAALKIWCGKPRDRYEADVDGFVVDILRNDLIIEIQTKNFASIRKKMQTLSESYHIRLVYPVPCEKWIIKIAPDGRNVLSRRKSPKRGTYEDLFKELVSFPILMTKENFSLQVLLIQEEEIRIHDGQKAWRRRGWITHERQLIKVLAERCFQRPSDLAGLIPSSISQPFTTSDLAAAMNKPMRLAQQMAYCLRKMDAIDPVGKRGRAVLYSLRSN